MSELDGGLPEGGLPEGAGLPTVRGSVMGVAVWVIPGGGGGGEGLVAVGAGVFLATSSRAGSSSSKKAKAVTFSRLRLGRLGRGGGACCDPATTVRSASSNASNAGSSGGEPESALVSSPFQVGGVGRGGEPSICRIKFLARLESISPKLARWAMKPPKSELDVS